MRRTTQIFLVTLLVFWSGAGAFAQLNPIDWSFDAVAKSDGEYDLIFTAGIDEGWYLYSQHIEEGGPIPTSFVFDQETHFELAGDMEESGPQRKEGHDELFDMQVIKYGQQVIFKQRIKVSDSGKPVTGQLEYMTCDGLRCLPPRQVDFQIPLE